MYRQSIKITVKMVKKRRRRKNYFAIMDNEKLYFTLLPGHISSPRMNFDHKSNLGVSQISMKFLYQGIKETVNYSTNCRKVLSLGGV